MKKRVEIPVNNPQALMELAKKVQARHQADGETSVLNALQWADINPQLEEAIAAHEKARQLKREMLAAFQQRDLKLEVILGLVRDSRDILSGVYKKEMKKLGQWGYEVMDVRTRASAPVEVKR